MAVNTTTQSLDRELLRSIVAADQQALAQLYDRYSGMLLGLIHRIVSNKDEAEDVLQEVFIQIWDKAESYNEQLGSVQTWIVIMTRNKSIERLRSLKRRGGTAAKILSRGDAKDGESSQPSVVADLNETGELMRGCLKGLDDKQREAIELAFLKGHTQEEIATMTEQPLGTIKARIRRGLMKLRDCLETKL